MEEAENVMKDYNTLPLGEQEEDATIIMVHQPEDGKFANLPEPLNLLPTSPFYGYDDGEAADEQETTIGPEQVHLPEPEFTYFPVAPRNSFFSTLLSRLRSGNTLRQLILLVGGVALVLGLSVGSAFAQHRMVQRHGMTADLRQQESAPVAKKLTRSQPVLTPATATPIPQKQTVMAQDDFQQDAEATSWTTTSDGKGRWEGDVSNGDFTIQHGIGWVAQSPNNKAVNGLYLTALLGPALQNSTVTADMALRNYRPDLLANDGVVLRYKRPSPATGNQSQYYKAYLDGAHLVILRKSAGVMTPLASVPFHAVAGLRYTLTFSANGNQLVTQVWQTTNGNTDSVSQNDGTSKKVTLSVQDSTLTNGQDGLRVLTQPDTLVQVYAVTVQQKNEP